MIVSLLVALAAGCRSVPEQRSEPADAATAPASATALAPVLTALEDRLASALPDRAGAFTAGPLLRAAGFVRRAYTGGDRRVEVTLAGCASTPEGYAAWVEQSRPYPAAPLDVPEGEGSGFYPCSGSDQGERCDLHIQLRAGYHAELMSNGTATRADLEELLRGIPLRALSTR